MKNKVAFNRKYITLSTYNKYISPRLYLRSDLYTCRQYNHSRWKKDDMALKIDDMVL